MIRLDYSKISDVHVDNIDMDDYPDFCDAYIVEAEYDGRSMTEEELDILNEDSDFVHQAAFDQIY